MKIVKLKSCKFSFCTKNSLTHHGNKLWSFLWKLWNVKQVNASFQLILKMIKRQQLAAIPTNETSASKRNELSITLVIHPNILVECVCCHDFKIFHLVLILKLTKTKTWAALSKSFSPELHDYASFTKTFASKHISSKTFNCSVKRSYENREIEIFSYYCTTRNHNKIFSASRKLLNGSRRRHETFRLHHIFLLHNVTRKEREREKNWLQSCFVYIHFHTRNH